MNKHTTKITSKSIDQGGVPADYKKALSEYIWNGFDAGATTIQINFEGNELGFLDYVVIEDNGSGINISQLDSTFGNFLDSQKTASYDREGFIKGKKGKGRYAFNILASNCIWHTRFAGPNEEVLEYNIAINKSDQQNFTTSDKEISSKSSTGTKVQIYNFFDLTSDLLENQDFNDSLAAEFGWFLYLNRDRDFKILINDIPLEYNLIISESETFTKTLGEYDFIISFIRWERRIGDKYFYYFLNSDKRENSRKHTSFNNKTIDFHH